jgi:hypothetical protein
MKKLSIILVPGMLFFTPALLADSGWTDYASLAELVPTARHYYELRLPVKENPSSCREKNWFYQDYSSMGSEMMFNSLLEGVKSRVRLRVYVTGKCNINGYSEISSVSIVPYAK